jgi:hypothetical protein
MISCTPTKKYVGADRYISDEPDGAIAFPLEACRGGPGEKTYFVSIEAGKQARITSNVYEPITEGARVRLKRVYHVDGLDQVAAEKKLVVSGEACSEDCEFMRKLLLARWRNDKIEVL